MLVSVQQARRECTESKEKFIRLSITLEESRACIDKLLKKLDGASKPAQASDRKSAADDNYEFKEGSVEDVNGLIVGPLSSVDSLGGKQCSFEWRCGTYIMCHGGFWSGSACT